MDRKSKDAYINYVCPKCWNTLDECDCRLIPYDLVMIDRNIQEHIRILNNKGYRTMYCCESHMFGNTYIMFADDYYFDESKIPKGFKYHKKKRLIEHNYDEKMSVEEFEESKKYHLGLLLEWCKSLPETENDEFELACIED